MFKKILLPLDLTDKHRAAVGVAAEMAGPEGELTLLHVIEVIAGLPVEEEKDFYGRLEQSAREHLGKSRAALGERRVTCRERVLYGDRAAEVARFAAEEGVELIVLTCPRPDPDNPVAGWGSLGHKIGLLAPCPVLMVK